MNEVHEQLCMFVKRADVPHLLIEGPSGSGKRHAIETMLDAAYGGGTRDRVLYIDCVRESGIDTVRTRITPFAKASIPGNAATDFKMVVLLDSDRLTRDAQSALRRCVEVHGRLTRFAFLTSRPLGLLAPIRSRLVSISCRARARADWHTRKVGGMLGEAPSRSIICLDAKPSALFGPADPISVATSLYYDACDPALLARTLAASLEDTHSRALFVARTEHAASLLSDDVLLMAVSIQYARTLASAPINSSS